MSDRAPYSRVYWSIRDDPKFDGIREDARLIGSWLLLLIEADMAYPSWAYVPPTVSRSAVQKLADQGLVEVLSGHRFRVSGLHAEREKRKALATTRGPSGDRPVTVRSQLEPVPSPSGDLDKDRVRDRDKVQTEEARDPADIYWQLMGRWPTEKATSWIDGLAEQYGTDATIEALAKAHIEDPSAQTILGRTRDRLAADARKLDRAEREAEKQRLREKRAAPRVEQPWMAEYRAAIEKQYGDAA